MNQSNQSINRPKQPTNRLHTPSTKSPKKHHKIKGRTMYHHTTIKVYPYLYTRVISYVSTLLSPNCFSTPAPVSAAKKCLPRWTKKVCVRSGCFERRVPVPMAAAGRFLPPMLPKFPKKKKRSVRRSVNRLHDLTKARQGTGDTKCLQRFLF